MSRQNWVINDDCEHRDLDGTQCNDCGADVPEPRGLEDQEER